ncbi:hypothetical protein KIPB_005872, partial [Kipferlia bialata]
EELLYSPVFGYYDVIQHPCLDECIDHIKGLRQYHVLMAQGETEAAEALNTAARKRVDDREQARADRWRAGLEASRGCK